MTSTTSTRTRRTVSASARRAGGHAPLDRQRTFGTEQIIVSKTDLKGTITYANDVFADVSGFSRAELEGRPHTIVRHPDQPGGIFAITWSAIEAGREVFAYIKNLAKDGSYYWVLAHVTPTWDTEGDLVGYHSSRRVPEPAAIREITPVYARMAALEAGIRNRHEAAATSSRHLLEHLASRGLTYDAYVWEIINRTGQEV